MTPEKNILLNEAYDAFYKAGFLDAHTPLDVLEKIVSADFMGYGTARDERIDSVEDMKQMITRQRQQSEGVDIRFTIVPAFRRYAAAENMAVYVDEITVAMHTDDVPFHFSLRFTVVFEYEEENWKIIHMHGSVPGQNEGQTDTWGIDEWKTRNRELEKMVAEKTADLEIKNKELEIEAALERVRAASMAMVKSEHLLNVITVVAEQLEKLGIQFDLTNFRVNEGEKDWDIWIYGKWMDKPTQWFVPYFDHPYFHMKSIDGQITSEVFTKQDMDSFTQHLLNNGLVEAEPETEVAAEQKKIRDSAKGFAWSIARVKGVSLNIANNYARLYTEHENSILMRFTIVFEQVYTRFLDLQKAEAQSREAQIELGLERVRARAMAMHKSNELMDAGEILYRELLKLGITSMTCGYVLMDAEEKIGWIYAASPADGTILPKPTGLPHTSEVMESLKASWKKQEPSHVIELDPQATIEHHTYLAKNSIDFLFTLEEFLSMTPERVVMHSFNFTQGYILVVCPMRLTSEQEEMVIRFTKVFEMTYRRFLDLQKAEVQSREAQIELGLERVRARAMAMHNSQDLADTIGVFYRELQSFSITPRRCGVGLLDKESRIGEMFTWNTTEQGESLELIGRLKLEGHPVLTNVYEHWLIQKDYYPILRGNEIKEYYKILQPQMAFPDYQHDDALYGYFFFFNEGGVYAWTEKEIKEDELQIYRRFTSVLSLTYKRYEDLRQAEAQSREAKIETALEKVRSRTLAMQKSDELAETAAEVFKQLIGLGIEPNRLYIGIVQDESGDMEMWGTDEDGMRVGKKFMFNKNENSSVKKLFDGWRAKEKSVVVDMEGKELEDYFSYLNNVMHIPFKGGLSQKRRVQSVAYFSKGFIGMASPDGQGEETIQLLERFAGVFNLTFTRFNDLKIAEAHAEQAELDLLKLKEEKKRTEEALAELQVTQKQLIQAEKMASLGELTAGIAHEIQNPLNFVNNFSEVNKELLEELKAERLKPNAEREEALENELINDVISNEEKINHHGKRADAIVKGMLQHSRSNSGIKEPTDINALADEYLRLAYHGLRAKDKFFNATMITDYDDAIGCVNIIPQDIGRVILNLITNAFYAVTDRKKQNEPVYEPTVSISTKKINNSIEIKVTDNGKGIPLKVIDKIFQPFFTTKPTGEGTGLGLSMSYDIITKGHGGEVTVTTKEGDYTEFSILLPLQSI